MTTHVITVIYRGNNMGSHNLVFG